MFKSIARGLTRLFSDRALTALRRDASSGSYVEDRDYPVYLQSKKKG